MRPINVTVRDNNIIVVFDEEKSVALNIKEAEKLADLLSYAIIEAHENKNHENADRFVRHFQEGIKQWLNPTVV